MQNLPSPMSSATLSHCRDEPTEAASEVMSYLRVSSCADEQGRACEGWTSVSLIAIAQK